MRQALRKAGGLAAALAFGWVPNPAAAIEGGASFYLLGGKLPLSGIVPGPGLYFQNDVYLYQGNAGADIELPFGGQVIAGVDASLVFEAPTFLAVTPYELLGGRLGFGATFPVGYADITASIGRFSIEDDVFTVGDPIGAALLGWDFGNVHTSLGASVNFPIGDYQDGEIANVALHRWAGDVTGAATWFNPAVGLDLSAAVGVTFNGENEATDYDSGNEVHLEVSATQHLTKDFWLGVAGYHNEQVSGDTGEGARLGDFEGDVTAIGGLAGYQFELDRHPVSLQVKYFHELEAKNRLKGDAVYLTVATPLYVAPPK